MQFEQEGRTRDLFLERLVAKSVDIKNKIVAIDDKRGKKGTSAVHLNEMVGELELEVSRMGLALKDEKGGVLTDLRDHIVDVYQRMGVQATRKSLAQDEAGLREDQQWKATCDRLLEDHQAI